MDFSNHSVYTLDIVSVLVYLAIGIDRVDTCVYWVVNVLFVLMYFLMALSAYLHG
jgi:hypothetical protein